MATAEERLQRFFAAERQCTRDLDELNRQLNESVTTVEFATPELGRHRLPVITLDLRSPAEGERDKRVPTVFIGGIATSPYQERWLSELTFVC